MGAASSINAIDFFPERGTNGEGVVQWLSANDMTNLEQAKDEVSRLRKLAEAHFLNDKSLFNSHMLTVGKARGAVVDKNFAVDTTTYTKKVFEKNSALKSMLNDVINSNILFRHCKNDEKVDIVDAFESIQYEEGVNVITQGDPGDNFYIVEEGSLDVYIENVGKVGSPLGQGSSFGELALMYNTPRAATVRASSPCKLWFINRTLFRTIITYFQLLRTSKYVKFLAGVRFGDKTLAGLLSNNQLEQIAGALEQESFQKGEFIIRQGQEGDYFYIVEEGEVGIYKTDGDVSIDDTLTAQAGPLAVLSVGAYFGEKALLAEDRRQASCIAETNVKCLTLGRDDFVMMLGNLEEIISSNGATATKVEEISEDEPTAESTAMVEEYSFKNLNVIRTLGCGAFGRVKLVQSTTNGRTFALKCQAKKAIVDNALQEHVLNERLILTMLNHQFILNIHGTFKDDHSIYFVLELLQGGELFTHLRNRGQLVEKDAKFYGASVLLAFVHMHAKNIAYRDLKPENLVLDKEGYLKVVDFGLAKVVDCKTWTLCGTPDYLAPEIILNEGHDKAVDYWALGVLLYEMVTGVPPFYADDPMEVYEKILSAKMSMPHSVSKNLADIIRKLCKLHQSKRLGNGKGGTSAIVKHKWFSNFDFKGLTKKELIAPIIPKVSNDLDASNFDDYVDADEPDDPPACFDWDPEFN